MSCLTDEHVLEVIRKESGLGASWKRHEVDERRKLRGGLKAAYDHLAVCEDCWNRYVPLVTAERDRILARLSEPPKPPQIENCLIIRPVEPLTANPVYKAWWTQKEPVDDEDRRRLVALKHFIEPLRALPEFSALEQIQDPNVASCRIIHVSGPYTLVDWIDGEHLDIYAQTTHMSMTERLRLFEKLCSGVEAVHKRKFVHRDLKPSNIMVDDNGQPYLIDFGISKHDAADAPVRVGATPADCAYGTPEFMAPEQFLREQKTTRATDIYALGINLYIAVGRGKHPVEVMDKSNDRSFEALKKLTLSTEYPPKTLSLTAEDAKELNSTENKLQEVFQRCTRYKQEHRFQSAGQLERAVRRCRLGFWRSLWHNHLQNTHDHPWLLHMALPVAVLVLVFSLGKALDVGWQVRDPNETFLDVDGKVQNAVERTRDRILVVAIHEAGDKREPTRQKVERYAAQHGIARVDPNHYRTWRPVHGELMKKLASAEPLAVVFDMYFPSEQDGDDGFVAGAEALLKRGIPLVVGTKCLQESGEPDLSPKTLGVSLGDAAHFGYIRTATDPKSVNGKVIEVIAEEQLTIAAVVPDGKPYASLALATCAALLHPRKRLEFDLSDDTDELHLSYKPGPDSQAAPQQRAPWVDDGAPIPVKMRLAEQPDPGEQPDPCLPPGTLFAQARFDLGDHKRWKERTVRYEDVLVGSQDALSKARGKIVIVGDRTRQDMHIVKVYPLYSADTTQGCYLHADALCGLLAGKYRVRAFPEYIWPRNGTIVWGNAWSALAAVVFAAALRLFARRHKPRRSIHMGLLTMTALAGVAALDVMRSSTSLEGVNISLATAAFAFTFLPLHWSNTAAARRFAGDTPHTLGDVCIQNPWSGARLEGAQHQQGA